MGAYSRPPRPRTPIEGYETMSDSTATPATPDTGVQPLEFTPEELTTVVELWTRLLDLRVNVTTEGYYGHPIHLDECDSFGHRFPQEKEIRNLVMADGEATDYPADDDGDTRNPWSMTDTLEPFEITLISCGDYHGSDLDAANNRALEQNFVGVTVNEPNTGGMGSVFNESTVMLGQMSPFGDNEEESVTNLTHLVEAMEGLQNDTALLDDEIHAAYVTELATEAWDQYLCPDMRREIRDLVPESTVYGFTLADGTVIEDAFDYANELWDNDNMVEQFREAYYAFDENEWLVESGGATSVINGRHDDAVKYAARTVFKWNV